MEFTVSKVTSHEELSKIEDFIQDNYLPDLSLITAFGLENIPPSQSPGPIQQSVSAEDFTLKAVDSQGEMIGVAINVVNVVFTTDSEMPPEVKEVIDFLNFIHEEAELDMLPKKTIELYILSVRKDWRDRGVAKRLTEESVKVARESGFKAMRVCCASEFVAKLVRRLGWKEHYSLAYKNYPNVSGKEVKLKPTPPHDYIYFYVTDL